MKTKIFTILACVLIAWTGVSAQSAKPFTRWGVGLEIFSTTGFGLEVGTQLNSHFSLRGGISMFPYSYTHPIEVDVDPSMTQWINDELDANPTIRQDLKTSGVLPSGDAKDINPEVDLKFGLGLVNGKLLVDYYPFKKASFHLTAGAYFGKNKFINFEGKMKQAAAVLNVLEKNNITLSEDPFISGPDDEHGNPTYTLGARDIMDVNAAIKTNTVKPYVGLGFGRAVPKHRVGASFELGAMFWGSPEITSTNRNIKNFIDAEAGEAADMLKKFTIWPVMSLKLTVRLTK